MRSLTGREQFPPSVCQLGLVHWLSRSTKTETLVARPELTGHSPDVSVATPSREAEVRVINGRTEGVFYGWWIVVAAFLNLFFAVGIVFYGFPVFYPSLVESLGFSRAQLTQGFFHGFLFVGLPCGLLAGVLVDRIGARWVILVGAGLVGASLVLMARITKLWHYEALCILEVLGYVLAGPIANQVLVARWFKERRGQAMGYAYLGLGLGGVVSPLLVNHLIGRYGWGNESEH